MVGKKSLTALCCASALLLTGAGSARAADDGIPYEALVEVTVADQATAEQLFVKYDAAEYRRVNDDGTITLNLFVTNDEKAGLEAKGFKIGATIEDSNTGPQRMKERQATIDAETLAAQVAENGLKGQKFQGQSVVPTPGDTVIQRANTFTDVVGPAGGRTTARFLYVEAFNKSTKVAPDNSVTGPALALSYAGDDGVYVAAQNMGRFIDPDTTPQTYMYHRQLFRLPATAPANIKSVRVATAATTGGAEASVETFAVTEWLGKDLPPHVAGFKNQPFFTKYMDPTENRADLDALAAANGNLMSVELMPEKTSGYQRKSAAIMNGTGAITAAPPVTLGATLLDTTGEITGAAPVATIPFNATAGTSIRATVDGIPSASTDFILTIKDPSGTVLQSIDTGTSPELINQAFLTSGTYTFEVSGFQGDVGDFTFRIQTTQTAGIVLTAKDYGQDGGNQVMAEFRSQTGNNQPLSVAVNGKLVEVFLATDAAGALSSTAAQVVAAINAKPEAAALLTASMYRGITGSSIVQPRARVNLSDFLNAPASVARGPFQQHLYRIGTHRDGTKPGVFLFCQQHAREWATGLTCVQTAHELVENYATDPWTKELLDNVEIFISPNSNPDGAHYSMYDSSVQRKTLPSYCPANGASAPDSRNQWGVDMNRNSGEYSLFDGYVGASTTCTSETFAGPGEYSEPETRNEKWVTEHFPNVKFANNIHSYGGYFMWAPGSYKDDGQRTTAPAPNIGIERYFFEAGEKILKRIKDSRGTVILPERTGPIADVLYSAAGNSADDMWYRKGIIAYSFETGADRFVSTTTGIQQQAVGFQPCFGAVGTGGGQGSCPANGSLVNEGRDEALEFAAGNFGMVESAYEYGKDVTPPATTIDSDGVTNSVTPINYRFTMDNEPSVIHYTTDGSTPTLASPTYNAQRARSVGEVLTISAFGRTTVKWLAVDIKGNVSAVQSKTFGVGLTDTPGGVGGTVGATLALSLGTAPAFGAFTPGIDKDYTAGTTANVISTAGDATLSVADPSSTNPGKLMNGTFTLANPLQVMASSAGGTGSAFAPVSGTPTTLLTYSAPKSNDTVTITYKQSIGRTEALRTGSYSKTLTYTLSTTTP